MIDDFLWRGLIGGIGVALVAGPLGCFIVWRRMSYFGDSLAHSALLGVALGLILGLNLSVGIAVTTILLALLLVLLQRQRQLASDTLLGIMAHAGLALGLVTLSFFETLRVDLWSYLFGDILSLTMADIYTIYGGGLLVLGLLFAIWPALLIATIDEDLARAEGTSVTTLHLVFVVLIALTIAIAMKIVGILLITSLLIIPAAGARLLSRGPEAMAAIAMVLGALAVAGGLFGSYQWDTPSGPSVVVAALLLFLLCWGLQVIAGRTRRPAI